MENKEEKVIKTGTEFLSVIGLIFILLGLIGSVWITTSFDWGTYNDIKGLEYTYAEELSVLKPQLTTTIAIAGATFLFNVAVGSLFIAVDKIALILKKTQLGIKEN